MSDELQVPFQREKAKLNRSSVAKIANRCAEKCPAPL